MKKRAFLLILVTVLILLSGCDYYSDAYISVVNPGPDSIGVTGYRAGVSEEKHAARLFQLDYRLEGVTDGKIKVTLPEMIADESGAEYSVDSFGGPTGPSAPSQKFKLSVQVQNGTAPENPLTLTVDAGALPLVTSYWDDIEIVFSADGTVTQIPLESVAFLSDEPLVYELLLKIEKEDGSVWDARDSDMWYNLPAEQYRGGEKVIIQLRPSGNGSERQVKVRSEVLEPVSVNGEYIQYEFTMPYHGVTVMVTDTAE